MNSGFGAEAEFDEQYDSTVTGWKVFLENLRLHVTHFVGRRARSATFVGGTPGPNASAWSALCAAVGVPRELSAGDRFETTAGGPTLTGVIERVDRRDDIVGYIAVLDGDQPGTAYIAAEGVGDEVGLRLFLYLYADDAEKVGDAWMAAIAERFPASAPALP